jgi:hypothetical protein
MSDKYYEIEEGRSYQFLLKYRSSHAAVVHFGVACYDQDRNLIHPVQVINLRFRCADSTKLQLQSLELKEIGSVAGLKMHSPFKNGRR